MNIIAFWTQRENRFKYKCYCLRFLKNTRKFLLRVYYAIQLQNIAIYTICIGIVPKADSISSNIASEYCIEYVVSR